MAKNKKTEKPAQTPKNVKDLKSMMSRITEKIQTPKFQISMLVFSIIWLVVMVFMTFRLKRLIDQHEKNSLINDPYAFINSTFVMILNSINGLAHENDKLIGLFSRIERIAQNETHHNDLLNVSLQQSFLPTLFKYISTRSQFCEGGKDIGVIQGAMNVASILINISQGSFPFCEPANIYSAVINCVADERIMNSSIKLIETFVANGKYNCFDNIVSQATKVLKSENARFFGSEIIQYIHDSVNLSNTKASKTICSSIDAFDIIGWTNNMILATCALSNKMNCQLPTWCEDSKDSL